MRITADISLYPLAEEFTPPIRDFIVCLRAEPGLEVITNQLSTQVRGEYATVIAALDRCMRRSMEEGDTVVFVLKLVNADLPIADRVGAA